MMRPASWWLALLTIPAGLAGAAEFRAAADPATVLYDAPSLKAKAIWIVGRDYPLEVVVNVEGWLKVRDATGALAWVEKRATAERRTVLVRVPVAEVRSAADPAAPVVFKAEQSVLLELVDPSAAAVAGWLRVRHRDGPVGFARLQDLWGL